MRMKKGGENMDSFFRMINIRYILSSYIWATVVYIFWEWPIPTYDWYQTTLHAIYWSVFPLTRLLLDEIKGVFFSNIEFWMSIHIWYLYLGVKFLVFASCYVFSFILAPLGFFILLFRLWPAKE